LIGASGFVVIIAPFPTYEIDEFP